MGIGAALDPLDRLRKRLALQDPVARYQFLGLREWAVNHRALVAGEPHSRALGTWLQPVAIEHHAGLHHLLVELRHGGEDLLGGQLAGLGVLGGLDHHHESHLLSPISLRVREPGMNPALSSRRTEPGEIDKDSIFSTAAVKAMCSRPFLSKRCVHPIVQAPASQPSMTASPAWAPSASDSRRVTCRMRSGVFRSKP